MFSGLLWTPAWFLFAFIAFVLDEEYGECRQSGLQTKAIKPHQAKKVFGIALKPSRTVKGALILRTAYLMNISRRC